MPDIASKLKNLDSALHEVKSEAAILSKELEQKNDDLLNCQGESINLQKKQIQSGKDLKAAEKDKDDAITAKNTAAASLTTVEGERDTCKTDLGTRTTERDNALTAKNTAEASLTAVEGERDTCKTDLGTRTTERDNALTAKNTAAASLAAVEGERDTCKTDLGTRTTERDNALTTKNTAEASLTTVEGERDTCKTDLGTRTTERDNALTAKNTAAASLTTVEGERDTYKNDLGTRTTERDNALTAKNTAEASLKTASADMRLVLLKVIKTLGTEASKAVSNIPDKWECIELKKQEVCDEIQKGVLNAIHKGLSPEGVQCYQESGFSNGIVTLLKDSGSFYEEAASPLVDSFSACLHHYTHS